MRFIAFPLMVIAFGFSFAGLLMWFLGIEFKPSADRNTHLAGVFFSMLGPATFLTGVNLIRIWALLFPEIAFSVGWPMGF